MDQVIVDKNYSAEQKATDGEAIVPKAGEAIIRLKNIHKTYLLGIEGVPALRYCFLLILSTRGVSVEVYRGEFVVIFGTSGGGKTSLLNIIGTIDKPTKGEMTICDFTINPDTTDEILSQIRLSSLGFVFQSFNLLSSMTALENVELPMTLKAAHGAAERRNLALASLERVGLEHRADHFPNQLSGGEQQRVALARAIANQPALLLLDEPTGDLDSLNTTRVLGLLTELNAAGMTMVMVTHDMSLKNFAHRVIWMRDGKVAKLETINPEKRKNAIADLHLKLDGLSTFDQGRIKPTLNNTEFRQPKQYLPYSYAK